MFLISDRAKFIIDPVSQLMANFGANTFAVSSEKLRSMLVAHNLKAESAIASCQILIALFILSLHVVANWNSPTQNFGHLVPIILIFSIASSLIRRILSDRGKFSETVSDGLTFADVSLFISLIWCYQYPYDMPAGSSLKTPSFAFVGLIIALRVFRLQPRPVLVAGLTSVVGWLVLTTASVNVDGATALTESYSEYLLSHKILIGAEVEKMSALLLLTAFLALAMAQARQILTKAAHSEDYLDALSKSEAHLNNLDIARQQTRDALSELQAKSSQLALQNDRFERVLENMGEGVCMFDGDKQLVVCNRHYADWYQLPAELVQNGTPHADIIAHRVSNGVLKGETSGEAVKSKIDSLEKHSKDLASSRVDQLSDGRYICVTRQPLPNGGWVATHQDVTEQHESRLKISHMALHDPLTNLPNRVTLGDRLEQALARVRRGETIAVHLLDLDHFKNVNDTLGHPIGDKLLLAVTERLNRYTREVDTIARMGGDEFAMIQASLNGPEDAEALAERMIETISAPYEIDGHNVVIGTSIGIAISPTDGTEADDLVRNADLALYRAKSSGRRTHSFFEPEMDANMQARRKLEYELRQGLVAGEFELYYQPIVDSLDQELTSVEALVRWNHPTEGLVSPGSFITLAEETGFINQLGEWIIHEACQTAAAWPDDLSIAINISPVQFQSAGIVEQVSQALDKSGLAPKRLILEITESVLLKQKATTLETLEKLQSRGIRIAMDDFGTGYSSLSYLQSFPFDKIKIDRAFIKNIDNDRSSANIVRAVAAMAEGMNISTTAEGVETAQQLARIRDEGCSEIQGFLISEPLPAAEIERRFISERDPS